MQCSGTGSPGPDATSLAYQPYGDPRASAPVFSVASRGPASLLREHVRLVHAHPHWEEEGW